MAREQFIKFAQADMKGLRAKFEQFQKAHYESMKRLWRDGIREFIRKVVLEGSIHILTGMSAASVLPLARKVGFETQTLGYILSQGPKAKKGLTEMSGKYVKDKWREMQAGERAGRKAVKVLYGSKKRPWMQFEFGINVYQYALHEPNWNTLAPAFEVWENFIERNMHSSRYKTKGISIEETLIPDFRIGVK